MNTPSILLTLLTLFTIPLNAGVSIMHDAPLFQAPAIIDHTVSASTSRATNNQTESHNKHTQIQVVILAAGRSTRFGTNKLLTPLEGQPLILYPANLFQHLGIPMTFVLGHQREDILSFLNNRSVSFNHVVQEEQQGTGHALECSQAAWTADHILVVNGDMPLIPPAIISQLIEQHTSNNAAASFVTAYNADPTLGYGRVYKTKDGIAIIEKKDLIAENREISPLVNAGIYIFRRSFLETYLAQVPPSPVTGERYLPSLIKLATDNGERVETVDAPFDDIRGVNTPDEFSQAMTILHEKKQNGTLASES